MHAQKEIRDYANVLLEICKKIVPLAAKSFEEHILYSVRFSHTEFEAIQKLLQGKNHELTGKELKHFEQKLTSGEQL